MGFRAPVVGRMGKQMGKTGGFPWCFFGILVSGVKIFADWAFSEVFFHIFIKKIQETY